MSVARGVSVFIPSSTSPTFAYIPISVKLTQPDIWLRRIAMAPAVAISPGVACPARQSSSAPPMSRTGSTPASAISVKRKPVEMRPKPMARSRRVDIASSAARSSCSPCPKSLTVLMLVIVSTTCPVTIARAAARVLERARMRGMNHLNITQ